MNTAVLAAVILLIIVVIAIFAAWRSHQSGQTCSPACVPPQTCVNGACVSPPPPAAPMFYGVGANAGDLWALPSPQSTSWTRVGPGTIIAVKYNRRDDLVYGVGADHNLYTTTPGPSAKWTLITGGGEVADVAFDPSGNLYGVGLDNTLYTKGLSYGGPWTQIAGPNNCCVLAIDFDAAGIMYALGTDHQVYTKASADPTSAWSLIPGSGTPGSIAIDRGSGAIYAAGLDNTLYQSPDLTKTHWAVMPGTCCYSAIGTAPSGGQGH